MDIQGIFEFAQQKQGYFNKQTIEVVYYYNKYKVCWNSARTVWLNNIFRGSYPIMILNLL